MEDITPIPIVQDPNMTDDIIRFYEAQVAEDEADGSRSPYLSTFTINEVRDSTGVWWTHLRYTDLVDSYGSVNMEPDRTTTRTTSGLSDGYKTVKWYRALKSGRYVIEWNINVWGNLNGVRWLRLMWVNLDTLPWTRTIQAPLIVTNYPNVTYTEESNYRVCVYLQAGRYFILQLYINSYSPWNVNINGRLKVFCIEDKYTIWMTSK